MEFCSKPDRGIRLQFPKAYYRQKAKPSSINKTYHLETNNTQEDSIFISIWNREECQRKEMKSWKKSEIKQAETTSEYIFRFFNIQIGLLHITYNLETILINKDILNKIKNVASTMWLIIWNQGECQWMELKSWTNQK